MGLNATKPVFGVSEKARLKPVSAATETSSINEISLVASLDIILSNKQITKSLIRLRRCTGWSAPLLFATNRRQVFSRRGPDEIYSKTCVKRPLSKRQKNCFQDQLSLNAGRKYCRMLPLEQSAILSTFIKLPFVKKIFVLSIF